MIEYDLVEPFFKKETLFSIANFFFDFEGTAFLPSSGERNSNVSFLWLFPFRKIFSKSFEALDKKIKFSKDLRIFPKLVGYIDYENNSYFQECSVVFKHDNILKKTYVYIDNNHINDLANEQKFWVEKFLRKDFSTFNNIRKKEKPCFSKILFLEAKESYYKKIKDIKLAIKRGDVYQVNLSHEMVIQTDINDFALFEKIIKKNPSSFPCYFRMKDFSIISSSPERLLMKKDKIIETCPIKGTMPRGKTKKEDSDNKNRLFTSEKERAELAMITDLSRNDLSKVSYVGSVKVNKAFMIEKYSNVFHMVSSIIAKPKDTFTSIEILRACFPGASITGCPKIAAMKMIKKLEKRKRQIYTGSIGYFMSDGSFDLNIAIRTVIKKKDVLSLQLGGAITHDSNIENEYDETLYKGKTIFEVLGISLF